MIRRWGSDLFSIFLKNHLFDLSPRLLVNWMTDVLAVSRTGLATGHRDEEFSTPSLDDLEAADNKGVINREAGECFQFLIIVVAG